MNTSFLLSPAIWLTTAFFSFQNSEKISGTITNAATGKPIEKVYVYTVKGEEETLSDQKGAFDLVYNINTTVTLYFEKKGYKPKKVAVRKEQKPLSVKLEPY